MNFKQSMLVAVSEVSDALVQVDKLAKQEAISNRMVTRSEKLVNNALLLYTYNDATYLEVIAAQTNKLQSELDLAAVKAQKLQAISMLYRSLGGGWQ